MVGWFLNVLANYWVISRTGPKTERLTILRAVVRLINMIDKDTDKRQGSVREIQRGREGE